MATFTNQAKLSYNGVTATSNTVTGEIVGALTITKTVLADEYSAGDTLNYVVTLVNSGDTDITGLTLTDDLGAYPFNTLTLVPLDYIEGSIGYFVNGAPMPAPSALAGDGLTVTGINVPAGGSAVIVYSAKLNSFAPLGVGASIENTASAQQAKITAEVTASATIPAADAPSLGIQKAISPASVTENGQLTYTFVITNTGGAPADAAANTALEDTFSPVLTGIEVTLDGAALTVTEDYTYDEITGEFATVPGVITVPAASFTQNAVTGEWTVNPGAATLVVKGTV